MPGQQEDPWGMRKKHKTRGSNNATTHIANKQKEKKVNKCKKTCENKRKSVEKNTVPIGT